MKTVICTLGALAMAASLAIAQDNPQGPGAGKGPGGPGGKGQRPPPEEIFKKLDANADGALSLDEFKAGPMGKKDPAKAEEVYKKIDADANGSVSLEEFKAHKPPHRKGGPGGEGGKGGKGGPGGPPPAGEKPAGE